MRRLLITLLALLSLTALAACGGTPGTAKSTSSEGRTRAVEHEMGTSTIPVSPQRIVSTSVVLTGTLLAIDAPVVGSGGSKPGAPGLDERGWWDHWSSVALERGVAPLFDSGNLDLEAIAAARPDVIIVSATGGDSFADKYEQLSQIAPTLVIDYNSTSWEDVTRTLGKDLGREKAAEAVLQDFEDYAAQAAQRITPPSRSVDLAVYSEGGLAVGLPTAPQAEVLSSLGIPITAVDATAEKGREDFLFATPEQANELLTSPQMLLVGNDEKDLAALEADQRFAHVPSVAGGDVQVLGLASFKLDYYSAKDLVDHAVAIYGR